MQVAHEFNGFDDLGADFESVPVIADLPKTLEEASGYKSERKASGPQVFTEPCPRCRGTGRYHCLTEHGGICLKCKGKGKLEFTTSPEKRAAARAMCAKNSVDDALVKLRDFEDKHPDIAAWWANTDFPFALSLRDAATRFGRLTDGQLSAAQKSIAKLSSAKAEHAQRQAAVAASPVLDLSSISNAMGKARDNGIKRPKMRLLAGDQGFALSFAPDTGKWAGSLYAKDTEGTYLGRITAGRFHPSRDTSQRGAGGGDHRGMRETS